MSCLCSKVLLLVLCSIIAQSQAQPSAVELYQSFSGGQLTVQSTWKLSVSVCRFVFVCLVYLTMAMKDTLKGHGE